MTQGPLAYGPAGVSPGAALGTIEALRMGWRLMRSDFWPLWTAAIVCALVLTAASCVPFGQIIATPPLLAGLVYVIMRRIDGEPVVVGKIFRGFQERFADSLLAMLPLLIVMAVVYVVQLISSIAFMIPAMTMDARHPPNMDVFLSMYFVSLAVTLGLTLLESIVLFIFIFAPVAVWQTPKAGWQAAKISIRLLLDHLGSMIGLLLLTWLIFLGAEVVGTLACCIGLLVTLPAVTVWIGGAVVFLYRSWTGQPLVQAALDSPPAGRTA